MKKLLILTLMSFTISSYAQRGYVHDAMADKYGKDGEAKGMDWINNKMLNVKVAPEYKFPVSLTVHVTNYKNGSVKDESDINYFFNTPANILGIKSTEERRKKNDETFIVYDYKENAMIMFNETDKTGMAINMNAFMSGDAIKRREEGKYETKSTSTSCKKTGRTKTIQGYPCFEYVCVDEDRGTRSEMWITTKLPYDLSRTNARGPMSMYYGAASGVGGMMIEAKFYKHEELETEMTVTNVDNNANKLIKSADYKFNKLN